MSIDLAAVRGRYLAALDGGAALATSAGDVPALLEELAALTARRVRVQALHSERLVFFRDGGSASRCNGCQDDWPCRTRRALDEGVSDD